jgi:O-Antigen ligase
MTAQPLSAAVSVQSDRANRRSRQARTRRSHSVLILQIFAVTLMVLPSTAVLRPIGAVGYPAALVGMLAFAIWVASTVLGHHDPQHRRHPVRGAFCAFWLVTLVSYVAMEPDLASNQLSAADRWPMQLAVMTGIALVTADCLDSKDDLRRVLRALTWGAAFCGVVAAIQYWANTDISHYLKLPGFTIDSATEAIRARGGLNRVSGTAGDAIELGVTAAMVLPLAIYMAIHDTGRSVCARWLPVPLIALAVPVSVSRSATIALAITMGFLIVLMPVRQRLVALAVVPIALAGVFMTAHGLIGTLVSYFGLGVNDSSITHRTNNYPYVEHVVREAPLFGHGGGTHINVGTNIVSSAHVLDNQFLKTAIELGLVGIAALAALFLVPMLVALVARKRSADPDLRLLCATVAGGSLAAGVCSFFFDSFSFPMFYSVFALVAGLAGASWRLATRESGVVRPVASVIAQRTAGSQAMPSRGV